MDILAVKLGHADVQVTGTAPGKWQFSAAVERLAEDIEELTIELRHPGLAPFPHFAVQFFLPRQDIVSRWHATGFEQKNLPVEWQKGFASELASGAPVYSLVGQRGHNRLTCAVSEVLRHVDFTVGVHEDTFEIINRINFFNVPEASGDYYKVTLYLDWRALSWDETIPRAFQWLEELPGCRPAPVPDNAWTPWYSTWYSYHQNLHASEIEDECRQAKALGMGGVIVDDGWQTENNAGGYAYCGDWEVAEGRIADMARHVRTVHDAGMKYLLWFSVPFIGFKSRNYARFQGKYLYELKRLQAAVLDPRFPEVRDFLTALYVQAQKAWGLDGFKLDFIDCFVLPDDGVDPAVAEQYAGRDYQSIPQATDVLLSGVNAALREIKPDILIEFRQKYIGPAVKTYGNMLRANDCPGDIVSNRMRTIDLRLSSGKTAVHADMIRWHDGETAESAARQLLAVLFAVPQISVRLADLSPEHRSMLRHRLEFFNCHRGTLLQGRLHVFHPEMNYPMVRSEGEKEAVTAVYCENLAVDLSGLGPDYAEIVVNASADSRLVVCLPVAARVFRYDVCGQRLEDQILPAGCQTVEVPVSGEAVFQAVTE